jgi:hypothetical protein
MTDDNGLLDNVRRVYERREKLGDIWTWAQFGADESHDGLQIRAKRFNAAARFAGNRKGQGDGVDWKGAQATYREESDRLEKKIKAQEADAAVDWSLGPQAWGGMRDFFEEVVYPVADKFGMVHDDDDKEFGHAVGGDHDPNVLNAFAEDFPTFSGATFARAVAARVGSPGGGVGTYNFIYYQWRGVRVRVQVLWAVADHFNHVHVGARRA